VDVGLFNVQEEVALNPTGSVGGGHEGVGDTVQVELEVNGVLAWSVDIVADVATQLPE
jgi:hypothetical protein